MRPARVADAEAMGRVTVASFLAAHRGQLPDAPPWPRTGEVSALYVLPEHQGRGVGRRLVAAVAAHLRKHGLPALTIAVLAANAPARGFYRALGGLEVATGVTEEDGHQLPEVVYGWPDTAGLG